jgi:hypothetical protein
MSDPKVRPFPESNTISVQKNGTVKVTPYVYSLHFTDAFGLPVSSYQEVEEDVTFLKVNRPSRRQASVVTLVVFLCTLASLGIGLYFAFRPRTNTDSEELEPMKESPIGYAENGEILDDNLDYPYGTEAEFLQEHGPAAADEISHMLGGDSSGASSESSLDDNVDMPSNEVENEEILDDNLDYPYGTESEFLQEHGPAAADEISHMLGGDSSGASSENSLDDNVGMPSNEVLDESLPGSLDENVALPEQLGSDMAPNTDPLDDNVDMPSNEALVEDLPETTDDNVDLAN